jgi:hypothetical protein
VHQVLDHSVLHVSNSLNVLLAQHPSAFFEKPYTCITQVTLLLVVSLLNKVNEGLGTDEFLKEALVLRHILHIQVKVKDVIC